MLVVIQVLTCPAKDVTLEKKDMVWIEFIEFIFS